METFATRARNLELRHLAVHGAISGLFFAQTVSWQQLVDTLVVSLLGVAENEPAVAFWRAIIVTVFTSLVAWGIITVAHKCDRCEHSMVGDSAARPVPALENRT